MTDPSGWLDSAIAAGMPEALEAKRLERELMALPNDTPADAFIAAYRQLLQAQHVAQGAYVAWLEREAP